MTTKPKNPAGVSLLALRRQHCRWPLGAEKERALLFCGEPSALGKPYCAEHCKVAFRPTFGSQPLREAGAAA